MAFCSACGRPLQLDDRFCGECGQKVEPKQEGAIGAVAASPLATRPALMWLGAGAALIVLIIIVAIPTWWHGPNSSQTPIPHSSITRPTVRPSPVAAPTPQPRIAIRPGYLGVQVSTHPPEESETSPLKIPGGAYVETVVSGSPADRAGLRSRDIIYSLNGRGINSKEELVAAISSAGAGTRVLIGYYRDGGPSAREITLGTQAQTQ
ncbi:MAG: PDZ domain-containing protein [Pseudorhodoplanes sp.]|jgi:S1-C subfamily serine protease|nr:PDZ domain-containing protein [Pseudorhodoplanes sp.]